MIKPILLLFLFSFSIESFAQHESKVKEIDSLVKVINNAHFKTELDSVKQDYSMLGLFTRTYLTMVSDGEELKKFVNHAFSTRVQRDTSTNLESKNIFYFDRSRLIKVEEWATGEGKTMTADWYYADNKPLYYTLKSEKADSRAALLLQMAGQMLEQFRKKR